MADAIHAAELVVGDTLRSTDPRDNGRTVDVEGIQGGWVQIRNTKTGRKGQLRSPLLRWEFVPLTVAISEEQGNA